ncbi:MAG: hypothetical protein H0V17_16415 [Deltaproteobacteria bacterium]|nr:hypothetical protein [Deltaproteobacteria bacterium]
MRRFPSRPLQSSQRSDIRGPPLQGGWIGKELPLGVLVGRELDGADFVGETAWHVTRRPLDEPREHRVHEPRETGPREPIVERLVRDGDIVLVIELAEEIRE